MFKLNFLDHVALRVTDLERSANWYEKVLGLERVQPEEWKPFPIMMLAGSFGIALFPGKTDKPAPLPDGDWLIVSHFAFNIGNADFLAAQAHLNTLNIPFEFEDHHYFHSIYMSDPDGYKVELTTLIRDF